MQVQLGGDPANVLLDVPDRFAAASLPAKDHDVVRIDLRVVSQDQAEQCGLARPVGSQQGPTLARADRPVDVAQDDRVPIANRNIAQPHQLTARRVFPVRIACHRFVRTLSAKLDLFRVSRFGFRISALRQHLRAAPVSDAAKSRLTRGKDRMSARRPAATTRH